MTTDLDSNKELVRAFIAAWNDREFDRFDDLMADTAVLNIGGATVPCNPAGTRAIAQQWTAAFPDWRFDLLSLVAEGDRVVAHMPYGGTFANAINGIAPTGGSPRSTRWSSSVSPAERSPRHGKSTTKPECGGDSACRRCTGEKSCGLENRRPAERIPAARAAGLRPLIPLE
jgi:predicted ester cyclase